MPDHHPVSAQAEIRPAGPGRRAAESFEKNPGMGTITIRNVDNDEEITIEVITLE